MTPTDRARRIYSHCHEITEDVKALRRLIRDASPSDATLVRSELSGEIHPPLLVTAISSLAALFKIVELGDRELAEIDRRGTAFCV